MGLKEHTSRRERKGRNARKWRLDKRERGRGEESGPNQSSSTRGRVQPRASTAFILK